MEALPRRLFWVFWISSSVTLLFTYKKSKVWKMCLWITMTISTIFNQLVYGSWRSILKNIVYTSNFRIFHRDVRVLQRITRADLKKFPLKQAYTCCPKKSHPNIIKNSKSVTGSPVWDIPVRKTRFATNRLITRFLWIVLRSHCTDLQCNRRLYQLHLHQCSVH